MKRSRFGRRSGLPREAEDLLRLATGLSESGCRAEDSYWESSLIARIDDLLQSGSEETLNAALDHLYSTNAAAYDTLADLVEARAECGAGETDILLLAIPVLAWSRFTIQAGPLSATVVDNLRVHLAAHVLASNVKLAMANILFSPEQLPQGYCETARFAADLGACARQGEDMKIDPESLPEPARFLSDVRYVLASVAYKPQAPIFRWQEKDGSREHSAKQWRAQGGACLTPVMAGCAIETVLPDGFFAASRDSERASRPYSLRASVAFLSTTLDLPPARLRAVVAPFYDTQVEEYRIGFTTAGNNRIYHGVVWPLLGAEEDSAELSGQIDAALRECGISDIQHIDNRFPLEYCDDCGTPMYPAPDGEAVHPELPEEQAEQMPRHLH